ncbi:MAG: ATP-binding protein [Candidatus Heimdallarchaeota archaeon]|nr:ATP-binding protein [Candidatus Heimdallarchaeota archaeon]
MNKWGIKTQALILALVPAIIISVSLFSYFLYSQITLVNNNLNERGVTMARHLAYESQYGIFSGNTMPLKRHTDERVRDHDIRSIIIMDKEKRIIINSGDVSDTDLIFKDINDANHQASIPSRSTIAFISPIFSPLLDIDEFDDIDRSEKHIIGWSLVEMSLNSTDAQINTVIINTLIITIIISIISIFLAMMISKNVTSPILSLSNIVKSIGDGNLTSRAEEKSGGELRILESGINKMAEDLQALQENLQSQVDMAITDLKETLELLQEKNFELEVARKDATEANKIKSEFLANMSHEIRTPINGIIGFADLMINTTKDTTQISHLDMIKKSSMNLLRIVDDILDMTRIEAGKLNINCEPLNLRDCVEQVVKMMTPSAFNKGIELNLLYYSDVPEEFYGDSLRITQIITNLVGNAIKFTETGSVTIRVMIEEDEQDLSLITFSIADTGKGISEEQKHHIFKPFLQGDSSTTKQYGGSGLGLSICSSLVKKMGGKLGLDSKINKGATFWFTLPLTRNNSKPLFHIPETLAGKRIFLFDASPISRLSIKHLLEKANIEVADNGDEKHIQVALKTIESSRYDIVLISSEISDMHFFEKPFFDDIHNKTKSLMLVIIPTIDNSLINTIKDNGADNCISKPVTRNRLYRALTDIQNDKNVIESPLSPPVLPEKNNKCALKILVAEDNEINANLMSAILERQGAQCSIAANGKIALDMLSRQEFDLVLMDINMPLLDGVSATIEIRNDCSTYQCKIPIIAVTANVIDKDKENFLDAGMNDIIIKPVTEKIVWGTIKKLVKCDCVVDDLLTDNINNFIPNDLYDKVISEISVHSAAIISALENNDMESLFNHTHKLNGLSAHFNIPSIRDVADKLETLIKHNKGKPELQIQVDKLNTEVGKINC